MILRFLPDLKRVHGPFRHPRLIAPSAVRVRKLRRPKRTPRRHTERMRRSRVTIQNPILRKPPDRRRLTKTVPMKMTRRRLHLVTHDDDRVEPFSHHNLESQLLSDITTNQQEFRKTACKNRVQFPSGTRSASEGWWFSGFKAWISDLAARACRTERRSDPGGIAMFRIAGIA